MPVYWPLIEEYAVSRPTSENKFSQRLFEFMTPPSNTSESVSTVPNQNKLANLRLKDPARKIIAGISSWDTSENAIQVDQMSEACLDWISRHDSRYTIPKPDDVPSSPRKTEGSKTIYWATREGHRKINDFTAMQAVLYVAAHQAGSAVEEAYTALRVSYDGLKAAFRTAQNKYESTEMTDHSAAGKVRADADLAESMTVEGLRQAVAADARKAVIQWHRSMRDLAGSLTAILPRSAGGSSTSAT